MSSTATPIPPLYEKTLPLWRAALTSLHPETAELAEDATSMIVWFAISEMSSQTRTNDETGWTISVRYADPARLDLFVALKFFADRYLRTNRHFKDGWEGYALAAFNRQLGDQ